MDDFIKKIESINLKILITSLVAIISIVIILIAAIIFYQLSAINKNINYLSTDSINTGIHTTNEYLKAQYCKNTDNYYDKLCL